MLLRDPFAAVASSELGRRALLAAGVALLVGGAAVGVLEIGPGVEELNRLVFAVSPDRAEEIVAEWGSHDRLRVAFIAGFDFVFGVAWTSALALGCFWGARQVQAPRQRRIGVALGWLSWIALILDVPENAAYLVMTTGRTSSPWPQIAATASAPRYVILVAGLVFVVTAIVATRREPESATASGIQ